MAEDLFIGRKQELKSLSSLLGKKSASLVVIRGRRRIGKSRLVAEFARDKRFFSFAGLPLTEKTNEQTQRDLFAKQLSAQLGLQVKSDDWSTLFSLLAKETRRGRVIILFDEISWMGSKDHLFLGKLKNAWDLEFKKNPQLILILCGSVSTWIEKNIISNTAFFGRISLFLHLEELPLDACRKLLLSRGFRGSTHEMLKILAVMGGIPWYLEYVQSSLSADDNLRMLCFQKEGVLFHEFHAIFHDLFEKRSTVYRPIVEVLAEGPMEFGTVCRKLRYSKSGTLSGYLNDLMESGFLTKNYSWSVKSGKPSRLTHYRLSDNYLRFYLKYIGPNEDRIIRGGFTHKALASLPGWNAMMGLQFENLVLKNREKIWEKLGIKPEDIVADNPYFQKKTSTAKGCQIGYLIQTRLNTLFACEIKFSLHPLKTDLIEEVRDKLAKLVLPKRFSCWPVLIHVSGVQDALSDSGYFSEIIDFALFLEE